MTTQKTLDHVIRFAFMSESEALQIKREAALKTLGERWLLHPINRKVRNLR